MAYEIGTAYIQIVPSFDHIQRELKNGARRIADDLGKETEKSLPDAMDKGVREGMKRAEKAAEDGGKNVAKATAKGAADGSKQIEKEVQKSGTKSADTLGDYFETKLKRHMSSAFKALPKVELDADSSKLDHDIHAVREQLAGLRDQKVKLGVNDEDIVRQARATRGNLRRLERNAPTSQLRVGAAAARAETDTFLTSIDERMGAFRRKWQSELNRGASALPVMKLDADTDPADRRIEKLRRKMLRLHDTIGVEIDEKQGLKRLTRLRGELEKVARTATSPEMRHNADEALKSVDAIFDSTVTSIERAEKEAAEKTRRLKEDEDKREAARQQRLEDQAKARDQRLDDQATARQQRLDDQAAARQQRLQDQEETARKRAAEREDREQRVKEARDKDRFDRELKQTRERVQREADEAFGKTFAGKISKQLDEAFKSLPDRGMDPARTASEQKIKDLRAELESLSNKRIGVDIDATEAVARVKQIREQLTKLAQTDPNVQIHVDTLEAAAKLAEVERMARRLDGKRINLKLDGKDIRNIGDEASVSLSRIEALVAAGLSIGTGLVPIAAVAASTIGFIATAAAAAASGVGVLALGFSGVIGAVQALNKYQQDTQKSTVALAAAQDRVTSATDSLSSATRSLDSTRKSAAEAARRSAQQVADAERAVRDAREEAARALRDAVEQEQGAQRNLTRVNVDAREAREALTRSYRDAAKALADLDSQIKHNALDQRQATLDVRKAKEELDKFLMNPRATEAEREQARIAYEERLQQIQDLQRQGKELAAQQAEANRKGLSGSDQVVAARQRVADADQRVADAQRALTKAHEGVVRAQLDGSRRVADAQRRVADAQRSQSEQQRQSAVSIAQAQQQVISAQRQLGQAIDKTSVAGGEAFQNLKTAMDNLSPAGQQFAKFIFSLKPKFDELRATAAQGLLPGVQKAFETALPYLPPFTEWVGKVAEALGVLFVKAGQFLSTNATWTDFFTYMGATAVPTLQQLGRVTRDLATGIVGLIQGFQPFNADIGQGLERLAKRFAVWASTLQANPSFQEFIGYVKDNGRAVIDFLRELTTFVGHFVDAAAPIGAVVLRAFTGLFHVINLLPVPILSIVLGLIAALAATMLSLSAAQRTAALVGGTWNKVQAQTLDAVFYLRYGLSTLKDQYVANVAATQQHIAAMQRSATAMTATGAEAARMRAQMLALNPAASGTQLAFANAGASLREMGSKLVSSEASGRVLGTTLGTLRTAAGLAKSGLGSLVGFLGGPWGVVMAAATAALIVFTNKQQEHKAKTVELQTALGALSNAYKEFKNGSKDALEAAVTQNAGLQNLILNTSRYGVTVGDIARALDGEEFAKRKVLAAYDAEIDAINAVIDKKKAGKDVTQDLIRLGIGENENLGKVFDSRMDERDAVIAQIEAHGRAKQALDILNRETEKAATKSVPQLANAHDEMSGKLAENERRIASLTILVDAFGNSQSTAAEKADALRRAIELQTGAKIKAIEAEEAEARGLLGLTSSVKQNEDSLRSRAKAEGLSEEQIKKNSRSLSKYTEEGLNNRDALEAAAIAVRDRYVADIEAGVPMKKATDDYQKRIEKLQADAVAMGLDKKKVEELVAAYGKVDPSVTTVYTQKGFDDIYKELEKLQVAQYALKHGIDPRDAWAEYNRAKAAANGQYPQGSGSGGLKPNTKPRGDGYGFAPQFFSLGGRVWGEGTSTSDSIVAMLSNREFVQPAAAVDYYGQGLMEAIRHRQLPREMFPGYASGGSVNYPFPVNTLMTRIPGMDEVRKAVLAQIVGQTKGTGGIGSNDMMRLLRVVFPGLDLYSGYRPGSRTPSGNLSYHGMIAADGDKGRAVDLPPKREVFDWIHDNYFSGTRELIWAGDKYRNIWNGRYHKYSDSLLANHGVAGQPNAHIHWAYDQGGYLPPGFTTVYNGTGRPEPVFTDGQWSQMSALLAERQHDGGARSEVHNHFDFANSTLDEARLNAIQQRQDALNRLDRPNW